MFDFSAVCKIFFSNGSWKYNNEVSRTLSSVLAPKQDLHSSTLNRMFNGQEGSKCGGLYNFVDDILDPEDKSHSIDFSSYIDQVSQRLSNQRAKFEYAPVAESINIAIAKSINLPCPVQEGLLKSYKVNRSKKVFLYLSEALYYSLLASCKADFEYQEIKGRFSGDYQELLTQPPYALTNTYKERNEKDEIWEALVDKSQKVFLKGLSGIGKSEFAKEIWKTVRENGTFKYLAWINYEGDLESSIYNQFLDLVDEPHETKRNKLNKMLREMDDELLIIVDNFYSSEEKDKFLIELSGRNCNVLVTTKELLNYSGFENYELNSLSDENCISLFKNYYNLEDDESKIRSIMNSIGRHTLLIELIAKNAYVEEFTLDELIELISEKGIDYSNVKVDSTHEVLLTEETIIRQTQLLFSSMQKRLDEEEIDLLIKFSIFKTLHFDKERIKDWFQQFDFKNVKRLTDRGWIKCYEEEKDRKRKKSYSIHAVPAYTITSQYDLSLYFDEFYSEMSQYTRFYLDQYLNDILEIIPYVKSFIDTFVPINESFDFVMFQVDFAFLLDEIVQEAQTCIKYLNNAKRIMMKEDFGIPEDLFVQIDNTLGAVHKWSGDIDTAEKIFLDTLRRVPDSNEEVTATYNNILCVYITKNDVKAIKKYVNKIEKYFRNNHDEQNSLKKAIAYTNLGEAYMSLKELTIAERFLSEAERILNFHLLNNGVYYPKATIDICLTSLNKAYAFLKRETKDFKEAEDYFRNVCAIYKEQFGKKSPHFIRITREYNEFMESINNDVDPD